MYKLSISIVEVVNLMLRITRSESTLDQYDKITFIFNEGSQASEAYGTLRNAKQGSLSMAMSSKQFDIGVDYYRQLQRSDYSPMPPAKPSGKALELQVKYEAGLMMYAVPVSRSPEELFSSIVAVVDSSGSTLDQYGKITFIFNEGSQASEAYGTLKNAKQGSLSMAMYSKQFDIGVDYYRQLQRSDYRPMPPAKPSGRALELQVKYEAGLIMHAVLVSRSPEKLFSSVVAAVDSSGSTLDQYGKITFIFNEGSQASEAFGTLKNAKQGSLSKAMFSKQFDIGVDYYRQLQRSDYSSTHPAMPSGRALELHVKYEAGLIMHAFLGYAAPPVAPAFPPTPVDPSQQFMTTECQLCTLDSQRSVCDQCLTTLEF